MNSKDELLERVEAAVREALAEAEQQTTAPSGGPRGVLSVTGKNQPGIVARFSAVLAELGVDIQDINQTVIRDVFTMVIVFDLAGLEAAGVPFKSLKERLERTARSIGVHAVAIHEDILNAMHRV